MPELAATSTKSFQGMLNQVEAGYIPLSTTPNKACANCRWFLAQQQECFIVSCYPEPILATGMCNRWEATPEPPADAAEIIAEVVGEVVGEAIEAVGETFTDAFGYGMDKAVKPRKSLKDRIRALFAPTPKDDAFSVFKGKDGKYYWHAVHTNNFKDLEGEILTEKAHDNYIARLDMGLVPMPVLQAWHTPGTEHGEADTVWRSGHFVHAVGHFYDNPIAAKAIPYYRKNAGNLKLSHGFTSPEWAFDGKHYDDYNTFEISTLPPHVAANPYTSFEELKSMAMTDEKRAYLEAIAGKDWVAANEGKDVERGKALEQLKVEYKDFANVTEAKPETVDTSKALGEVYIELVDNQNQLLDVVTLQAKALKAKDADIAQIKADREADKVAFQKQLDEVRTLLNAPIRRASQDSSTVRTDDEADVLKDKTPKDGDSLSKFLNLPTKGSQN